MKITVPIHGVLLLDKPLGWSSNHAVQKLKRLYQAAKVGHTGTLDPLATGMLPLCFGEATKFGQCLLAADKAYEAVVQLGQTTITGDREGEILETKTVPLIDDQCLQKLQLQFLGEQQQIPPMYSALKHQGEALYHLARRGEVIERAPRVITIHEFSLTCLDASRLLLKVRCSKGTYIRTLAEDIGLVIGCGAHLEALRRTSVAQLPQASMVTIEQLMQSPPEHLLEYLLPEDSCVQTLPRLDLNTTDTQRLLWGQAVLLPIPTTSCLHRLYNEQQQFLGIADYQVDGFLLPQRLINPNRLL